MQTVDKTIEELVGTQDVDCVKWAKAFLQLNPGADEDLMRTWFANAIGTAISKYLNKSTDRINKLESLLLLTDPVVSNVTMNEVAQRQWEEYSLWLEAEKFK